MEDIFTKSIYATLGAGLLVMDTMQDMVKDLIDRGKMAPEDARKFMDNLSSRAEEERNNLKDRLAETLKGQAEQLGMVRKEEVDKLNSHIQELESRMALLEAKETVKHKPPHIEEV